jgi:hypothetical protein
MESKPNNVIWTEGDQPEPVSEVPLEGFELTVLKVWLENSPTLNRAYRNLANREAIDQLVRQAVFDQDVAELQLRANGVPQHEAEDQTAPAMWTPPTWPSTPAADRVTAFVVGVTGVWPSTPAADRVTAFVVGVTGVEECSL